MKLRYIAIYDEWLHDYKWYCMQLNPIEPEKPLPSGCAITNYKATGRFVTRDDGEQAEIFEEVKATETLSDSI